MAKISTYDKDVSLSGKDKVVGSNYISTINSVDQYETANFTLKDLAEFVEGQINTSPVQLSLKTQGGIAIETINNTDVLAVNLSHTNITGQLANSDLVNSSITINGTSVALGGSVTVATGDITGIVAGTYLNGGGIQGSITINHDNTTRSNSTSSASPNYGASFTAIDSIVSNATGHITGVNTKTVTLPASDNTDTTYDLDLTQNSSDVDLKLDASSGTDTTIKFKAGSNVTLTKGIVGGVEQIAIASQAFGTVFTVNSESAMISATSTGGDIVIRTDVSKTFIHNGGSAGTAADFSELQFSGINTIALTAGDGVDLSRTTLTNTDNDLTITNSLATASERGGIKIGYTDNGKNYAVELDSEKAYVNVPWVNTEYTAGGGLDLSGTEFSHTDTSSQTSVNNSGRTYIQDITLDTYGHVTGLTSATETVTDTNDFVDGISVSGTNTKTITLTRTGTLADLTASFTDNDTQYSQATSSQLGLVKIGYTENAKNYPVELSSGQMFVNVPWVDTDTQYSAGTGLTLSGTTFNANVDGTNSVTPNASSSTASRTYKVQVDGSDNLVVNVPWVDTDTNTTNWNFKIDSGTNENIAAGNTVTFTSGTNVTLSQTGKTIDIAATNTQRAAGVGLSLSGNTINANVANNATTQAPQSITTAANRLYQIETDDQDNLVVNVPWIDTTDPDNNNYVTGASVSGTTTKTLTLTRQGLGDVTASWTDIDTNTQRSDEDIRDVTAAMLTAGSNITLTEDDANNTLTIAATDTDTNTTYTTEIPASTTKLRLVGSDGTNEDIEFVGTGATTVTRTNASKFTINSPTFEHRPIKVDSNGNGTVDSTLSASEDLILKKGTNITLTESGGIVTISSTDNNTFRPVTAGGNTLGGTETLAFTAGSNVAITENAGAVTIAATNTTYTAGTGLTLSGTQFSVNTTQVINEITPTFTGSNTYLQINGQSGYYDGAIKLMCSAGSHGQTLKAQPHSASVTNTMLLPKGSNSTLVSEVSTSTLTNKTLTQPIIDRISPSVGLLQIDGYSTTDGGIKLMCYAGTHGQILKSQPHSAGVTNTILMPAGGNSTLVSEATLGPLTTLAAVTGRGATTSTACSFTNTTSFVIGSSGSANLYLGNIISASSSDKGARFHSNNNDFFIDFQGDATQNWFFRDYDGSGGIHTRFAFDFVNAKFTAGGDVVAFGSPSDISLKENIKPIESALNKVEKLQGVTFNWKEQDIANLKEDIGFIAQDVQKVLPELVRENKDGKLSLRHQGIIPVLLEAIKELSDKVKSLENGSTK
jgi:hypothetical protein